MSDTPVTPSQGTDKKHEASSPLDQLDNKKSKILFSVSSVSSISSEDLECSINMAESTNPPIPTIKIGDDQMVEIAKILKGTFQSQLEEMVSKIVSGVVGGLQTQIGDLQKENNELKAKVSVLEDRIESLEIMEDRANQYSRRNCLRVSGLKESEGECTEDIVQGLIDDLDIDIKLEEIDRTHRLGRKPASFSDDSVKPRDIIIKFATYRSRQKLYKKRTLLRNIAKYKCTYVNEELTKKRGELLYQARLLVKRKAVKNAWSSDGFIFIEKLNQSKHRVETLRELERLKLQL